MFKNEIRLDKNIYIFIIFLLYIQFIMTLTYYGHSCFTIKIENTTLLFDPFITPNEKAKHIDINSIKVDYILLSHAHEDHIADAETIAKNTNATIISNFEIVSWYEKKGLTNAHPMNHGGSKTFSFGKVKMVNAIHSSTFADGSNGGNPNGFVIESEEGNFYFAGDTALTMDMKLIPLTTKIDFALLPIGDNFTMGIEDASICAEFVETKKVVGLHYDTFGYIIIDKQEAKDTFKNKQIELYLPKIGETIKI